MKYNESENEQKMGLSNTCIYFLKTISTVPSSKDLEQKIDKNNIKNFLGGKQVMQAMYRSIVAEEKFCNESFNAIDIERT